MSSLGSRARTVAVAAISCGLLAAPGCKRSLVWLDAERANAGRSMLDEPQRANQPSAAGAAAIGGGGFGLAGESAGVGGAAAGWAGSDGTAGDAGMAGPLAAPAVGAAGGVGPPGPAAGSGGGSPAAGAGGTAGAAGAAAIGPPPAPPPRYHVDPQLPAAPASCPYISNGTVQMRGQTAQIWVERSASSLLRGPLLVYWHGTGSNAMEAVTMLGSSALSDLTAQGGVLIALQNTIGSGVNTSTATWFSDDLEVIDDLIGCVASQIPIDPRRIYTAGCSSGGIQAAAMLYLRSNYVAAAMTNSGGSVVPFALQNPNYVPALVTAHGSADRDVVVINFAESSLALARDVASKGGFAVDCDHGAGHCGAPDDVKLAQWWFLLDHPYGAIEEAYAAGLPSLFPRYCKIIR